MSFCVFSAREKLELIEKLIVTNRRAARAGPDPAKRELEILKAIASDIRAEINRRDGDALKQLERVMRGIARSKTDFGYSTNAMNAAAQMLIAKWPTVRRALENYGEGD